MNAIRSSVSFYITDDKSNDSSSSFDDDEASDGVVWPTSVSYTHLTLPTKRIV